VSSCTNAFPPPDPPAAASVSSKPNANRSRIAGWADVAIAIPEVANGLVPLRTVSRLVR
jgi:hypothetical protein